MSLRDALSVLESSPPFFYHTPLGYSQEKSDPKYKERENDPENNANRPNPIFAAIGCRAKLDVRQCAMHKVDRD